MLPKHKTIEEVAQVGVVGIVRVQSIGVAAPIVRACAEGGIKSIEVTFTVQGVHRVLEQLSGEGLACTLGAGTILDAETARVAILSGAKFIVSPAFNRNTAKMCNRYAIPYFPGCCAPAEMIEAMEYGVDVIKLFPGSMFTPSIIKALKGPLPQAHFMPTGGVNLANAGDWIEAGALALGIGGDLTANLTGKDYHKVSQRAQAYVQAVAKARKEGG